MDQCRICLKFEADKDVYNIKPRKTDNTKSFTEVISFCLDIKITEGSNISTKLCMKCYRKIVTFYKFKNLALKNDIYLKSLKSECKEEDIGHNEVEVKLENLSITDDEEFELKSEEQIQEYESDNEMLSVLKKIKYEYIEETKENDPVKKVRGRKRKKRIKSFTDKQSKQVCEECGKTVKNMKDHMQLHLPDDKKKRIPCDRCDKTFSGYSAKYKHVRRKHLCLKVHCEICDKKVSNLKQHILITHNRDKLRYECSACDRRFISKSSLEAHMVTHTKDRPYECSHCDKRFRTKSYMLIHERQVHDREKSHLCQFCSKTFFKKYHLQVHLRSHTKEKPYPCPECGKSFVSSTQLKNHRLIHNDIKSFVCTVCNMSFVRSGYLKTHMISHIKDKKYPCQYCGVKFHRSDHRKRHEYTAHQRHLNTKANT